MPAPASADTSPVAPQRRRLQANPMDVEAQRELEDLIRQANVNKNYELAMEHMPEAFTKCVALGWEATHCRGPSTCIHCGGQPHSPPSSPPHRSVSMLYINTRVNGVPVKAFVDSGAQTTIMSPVRLALGGREPMQPAASPSSRASHPTRLTLRPLLAGVRRALRHHAPGGQAVCRAGAAGADRAKPPRRVISPCHGSRSPPHPVSRQWAWARPRSSAACTCRRCRLGTSTLTARSL